MPMIPRTSSAALSAVLVLGGSACRDLGPDMEEFRKDIARHRAVWESHRPVAYAYDLERFCNCTDEGRGPVRVRVQGKTVVERRYTTSGELVPASLAGVFPPVDGLFDILDEAARRKAWYINVTWDPDYGFPRDLYVDYHSKVADDEISYRVVTTPAADRGS